MRDELTFEYTNTAGNRRRVRFGPRDAGGWDRVVEERDGDEWRGVGDEIVADVEVTVGRASADVVGFEPSEACSAVTGPETSDR
jgi:hypothetical protein